MARDLIDGRLLGALHLRGMDRAGFDHDPSVEHTAFQIGTLDALMAGRYDGDGTVHEVAPSVTTPFAVLCRFVPLADARLDGPLTLAELHRALDALRLRSVHRQHPPYPPLAEVTAHQREWTVERSTGSIVGFRFPDSTAGVEVPGFHLHFLSADRRSGDHVLDLVVEQAHAMVDGGDELHVELPAGVGLGTPGVTDRAAIARVEGGSTATGWRFDLEDSYASVRHMPMDRAWRSVRVPGSPHS